MSRVGQPQPATGGVELASATSTSNYTQTGVGSSDVTGLTVTVTTGVRSVEIYFSCSSIANSGATGVGTVQIQEDGTTIASITISPGTTNSQTASRLIRRAPSAGSHTYKIVLAQTVTGNTTISASGTNPSIISVKEI